MTWLTNIPETASKLNQADEDYARAKLAAQGLNLADKIIALREAKAAKVRDYGEAVRG
jgi:hypothetical protein